MMPIPKRLKNPFAHSLLKTALICLFSTLPIYTLPSETMDLIATRPIVNSLSVTAVTNSISNLSQTTYSNIAAAEITLNSNANNGFTIEMSSVGTVQNAGFLVKLESPEPILNEKIPYTSNLTKSGIGFLGSDSPILPSNQDLSAGPYEIAFNSNVTHATTSYGLTLEINTGLKTSLISGTFEDTISLEIIDL
jgi:hypothetical protein